MELALSNKEGESSFQKKVESTLGTKDGRMVTLFLCWDAGSCLKWPVNTDKQNNCNILRTSG